MALKARWWWATLAVLAVAVTPILAGAGPAAAQDVTSAELAALAERAASDPAALARLRATTSVDGRPADLDRALAGAEGDDLRARLRALARQSTGAGAVVDAAAASAEARRTLSQDKFQPGTSIAPFRGVLRRVGGWLRPVGEPVGRLWARVAENTAAAVVLFVAVAGVAALASIGLLRRRTSAGVERRGAARGGPRDENPEELEARADAAERAGDLDLALRLRFRAGLARLDRAGVVEDRPALTTGELARLVGSPVLDGLTATFEEVTYGGRRAGPDDLGSARSGWPAVVAAATSRADR
ncbi:MAG: DUF4129 domain-containing protein [Actinomycetota bacterium]